MKSFHPSSGPMAAALAGQVKLSDAALALLHAEQGADDFVVVLEQHRLYADALRLLSVRLVRRHALWWGCLCLWDRYRSMQSAHHDHVVQTVVNYLRFPGERERRAAEEQANKAGLDTPLGMLAYAAFLNEGSMAPPSAPKVPADLSLLPRFVANALLLASRTSPTDSDVWQHRFVVLGLEVARTGCDCPQIEK